MQREREGLGQLARSVATVAVMEAVGWERDNWHVGLSWLVANVRRSLETQANHLKARA